MTVPRRLIVNPSEVGWYHCVSRCVRRAFLCGDGHEHRKDWVAARLRLLSHCFAVDVAAYAVMSNHLHVVVRIDPRGADSWTAAEVATKWLTVYAREHDDDGSPMAPSPEDIAVAAADWAWVSARRRRLGDLGWFMKALKEPIARRANREDEVTGHFWEGRFRSTALLDETAVIACMAYVDLNPIRARVASTPEDSAHTSIQDRIHARQYHQAALGVAEQAPERARGLFSRLDAISQPQHAEDGLWLWTFARAGDERLRPPMTAESYLRLVDASGRIVRSGKRGRIDPLLAEQLARLRLDAEAWVATMLAGRQMRGTGLGRVTARAVEAKRRGTGWVANHCPLFVDAAA